MALQCCDQHFLGQAQEGAVKASGQCDRPLDQCRDFIKQIGFDHRLATDTGRRGFRQLPYPLAPLGEIRDDLVLRHDAGVVSSTLQFNRSGRMKAVSARQP
jgi:hypothetical protein